MQYKRLIVLIVCLLSAGMAWSQQDPYLTKWGSSLAARMSHASDPTDCGRYQWPENEPACVTVCIMQKDSLRDGAHKTMQQYREQGWDTVVDCRNNSIELSCMPNIPVQYFNGYYTVDEIEYDSVPDPTYYLGYNPNVNNPNVRKMDITCDDAFAANPVPLDFPFFFFGKEKNQFYVGDNGVVSFTTDNLPLDGYRCPSNTRPYCPFSFSGKYLPWDSINTPEGGQYSSRMHDAIFGVFEDTYCTTDNATYPQGIYYGVIGEKPCRKIVASWNDIHQYRTGPRSTYMMVCYEGTNNIDVYVKYRSSGNPGIIGILNENGTGQTRTSGTSTRSVYTTAPTAFFPSGKNNDNYEITEQAWRFKPQGNTNVVYEWFRIKDEFLYDTIRDTTLNQVYDTLPNGTVQPVYDTLDDGVTLVPVYDTVIDITLNQVFDTLEDGRRVPIYDTVHLSRLTNENPNAQSDTNGWYYPMGKVPNTTCPTLSVATVAPTKPSRYAYHIRFRDANDVWYDRYDTIFVGVDKMDSVLMRPADSAATCKTLKVCANHNAPLSMEYTKLQKIDTVMFSVYRISNGQRIELDPTQCITLGEMDSSQTMYIHPVTLRANLPQTGVVSNKVDSIYIQPSINFVSNCPGYDSVLVEVYPNFDTTTTAGICQGETYTWSGNGRTYTVPTDATEHLTSTPGCDSTVHLHLTVDSTAYVIFPVVDCQPYTWDTLIGGNGRTYYESNLATATIDTVLHPNRWGCDSITQLEFTYRPVKAAIQSDREFFDFDHLDAVLTDISVNNDARVWLLPGGFSMSGPTAYYTIPAEFDEADIWLRATATYDGHTCVDSTHIVIPMRKETFWLPNIFIPGSATGNNLFGSTSTRTLTQEMFIYNRNGMLMFHCDTPDCGWDGNDMNGNPCPQGAYVYLLRYTNEFLPKVTHVLHGSVTLIR